MFFLYIKKTNTYKIFHTYKYSTLPTNNNKILIYKKMFQTDTYVYHCKT